MPNGGKRPLFAIVGVLVLLGLVAFVIGYLMRPSFVTSWPEFTTGPEGTVVTFSATNRTPEPLRKRLVVTIGDKRPTSAQDLTHPILGRQERVVEMGPEETVNLRFEFPPTEKAPTLAWVELAK